MTVALSTLASRIIYGLAQRVRTATELGQYTLEEKIGEGGWASCTAHGMPFCADRLR